MIEYLIVVCHEHEEAHFVFGDEYEIRNDGVLSVYKDTKVVASFRSWEVIRKVNDTD